MKVVKIEAFAIHENDTFHCALGMEPSLDHTPFFGNRGPVIGAYAIAELENGEKTFGDGAKPFVSTDPDVAKMNAVNDLMRYLENRDRFQSSAGRRMQNWEEFKDEVGMEPEFPRWDPDAKAWIDANDAVYDPNLHAGYSGDRPHVNKDNSFRARRGPNKLEPKPSGAITIVSKPGEIG